MLAAIPYAALLVNGFISFPSGTDALAYHINVALKWLQDGTMRVDPTLGWQYALPGNAELPALLALSLGMEKAVAVGNMLSVILLAVSLYLIAWKITRQNAASIFAVAVALTIPIVATRRSTFMWISPEPRSSWPPSHCFCGESKPHALHLSFGRRGWGGGDTKPVFWIYGAMYGLGAVVVILWDHTRRIKCTALLAAGLALPSAFWFYRAAEATGNPATPSPCRFCTPKRRLATPTGSIVRSGPSITARWNCSAFPHMHGRNCPAR